VRLLVGLIAPDSGSARIAGYELGHDSINALRSICGLLTDTPGFYDRISAWENLTFFLNSIESHKPRAINDSNITFG